MRPLVDGDEWSLNGRSSSITTFFFGGGDVPGNILIVKSISAVGEKGI
jgi:hypothetical protein